MRIPKCSQSGMTIIELLVASVAFLLLSTAILGITVVSQRVLVEQDRLAASEQETRGALLITSNSTLLAGCGIPAQLDDPASTGLNAAFTNATATAVTFRGCFSDPTVRTSLTATTTLAATGTAVLSVDSVAGFTVGNRIYVYSIKRWAYGPLTAVNAGASTLTVNFATVPVLPSEFTAGSLIFREEIMGFAYDTTTGSLRRAVAIPPAVAVPVDLVGNVTNLQLTYWDSSGTQLTTFPLSLADRRAVHGVGIDITVETERPNPKTNEMLTVRLNTAVQPRNLFAN